MSALLRDHSGVPYIVVELASRSRVLPLRTGLIDTYVEAGEPGVTSLILNRALPSSVVGGAHVPAPDAIGVPEQLSAAREAAAFPTIDVIGTPDEVRAAITSAEKTNGCVHVRPGEDPGGLTFAVVS